MNPLERIDELEAELTHIDQAIERAGIVFPRRAAAINDLAAMASGRAEDLSLTEALLAESIAREERCDRNAKEWLADLGRRHDEARAELARQRPVIEIVGRMVADWRNSSPNGHVINLIVAWDALNDRASPAT